MKKTNATLSEDALDALLGGTETIRSIPGTRPDLTDEARSMAAYFDPLLSTLPPADPPEGLFAAIEAEIDEMPEAPVATVRADEGTWEQRSEKVWKKVLARDPNSGRTMYLLRCLPGAAIKPHVHERSEHLFIIEGEFWIGDKLYSAGDAQVAMAGTEHAEIRMPGGCLVLVSA